MTLQHSTFPTALLTSLEDADFTFTEATGLKISVTDPDTYGVASTLKLTLSADSGTLEIPDLSGVSLISGSNESSAMILLGTPENLNLSRRVDLHPPHGLHRIQQPSHSLQMIKGIQAQEIRALPLVRSISNLPMTCSY